MTSVLEARTSDGSLVGRCDAKCHTAKGKKCKCICEGLNHGVGTKQALKNPKRISSMEHPERKYFARPRQAELFTPARNAEPL